MGADQASSFSSLSLVTRLDYRLCRLHLLFFTFVSTCCSFACAWDCSRGGRLECMLAVLLLSSDASLSHTPYKV